MASRSVATLVVVVLVLMTTAFAAPGRSTRAKGKKAKAMFAHRVEENRPGRGRKVKNALNDPRTIEVFKDFDAWFGEAREASTLAVMGKVQGIDHFVHPMSELADGISPNADVVLLTSNGVGDAVTRQRQNQPAAQANLEAFVRAGGVLIVDMGDNDAEGGYLAPGSIGTPTLTFPAPAADDATFTKVAAGPDGVLGTDDDHRLVRGPDGLAGTVDDLTNANIDMCCAVAHGHLEDGLGLPSNARVIETASFEDVSRPILAEYCLGSGRVIVDTVTKEFAGHQPEGSGPSYFLQSLLAYALDPLEHTPCQISGLREDVARMARGRAAQLDAKLAAAQRFLEANRSSAACGQLRAFANQVLVERKKGLPRPVSDWWVQTATDIGAAIGCK